MSRHRGPPTSVTRASTVLLKMVARQKKPGENMRQAVERVLQRGLQTGGVLVEVADERARQDRLWGVQDHPLAFGFPGAREQMEAAQAACDQAAREGRLTHFLIVNEEHLELAASTSLEEARKEAIQAAAVNVAIVERIDRMVQNGEVL